jgi:hypothetical protein
MDTEVEGTFHHATNPSGGWEYEARKEYPEQSIMLVAMVRVGNLSGTVSAAVEVIQSIPPDVRPSKRTSETFDCMVWLKDTIAALDASRVVQLPMSLGEYTALCRRIGFLAVTDPATTGTQIVSSESPMTVARSISRMPNWDTGRMLRTTPRMAH